MRNNEMESALWDEIQELRMSFIRTQKQLSTLESAAQAVVVSLDAMPKLPPDFNVTHEFYLKRLGNFMRSAWIALERFSIHSSRK